MNDTTDAITPLAADATPKSELEGVDHINVYSRSKTALGKALSNFSHIPFEHPKYGFFASMEAFWYWVATGMKHNELRRLYDSTAKAVGIRLDRVMMDDTEFKTLIRDGIRLKIGQSRELTRALRESTLPFRHYFRYGTTLPVIREPAKHRWQMEELEEIRRLLKAGEPLLLSTGERADAKIIAEVVDNPAPEDIEPNLD